MADPIDWFSVAQEPSERSDDDLEAVLLADPEDLRARVQLLSRYQLKIFDAQAQARFHAHIYWMIEHHPEVRCAYMIFADFWPDAYREAKRLWMAVLAARPDDPVILNNASGFLLHDRDLARDLMLRGAALEPTVAHWHHSLGFLYMLDAFEAQADEDRLRAAREALAEAERALELTPDPAEQLDRLVDLIKAASMAGELERSSELAGRILAIAAVSADPPPRRLADGIHHAHAALGNAALANGDLATALAELRAAGIGADVVAAPGVLGPDLTLATALLQQGEQHAVLEYLDAVGKGWQCPRHLNRWKAMIRTGETPSFRLTRGAMP
ncbi:MAG: hypothetical protein M3619_12660 [Myxococcota bacterium]|nr:hypothetical protein [Myxococcota bacterium]